MLRNSLLKNQRSLSIGHPGVSGPVFVPLEVKRRSKQRHFLWNRKKRHFQLGSLWGFHFHLPMQAAVLAAPGFQQSTCRWGSSGQERGKLVGRVPRWHWHQWRLTAEPSLEEQLCQSLGTAIFGGDREALARPCAAAGVGSTAARVGEGRGRGRGHTAATYPGKTVGPQLPWNAGLGSRLRTLLGCFCSLKGVFGDLYLVVLTSFPP